MSRDPKTLLLGIGNPILTDDGVGTRLVSDLARFLEGTSGLDVLPECPASGLDLIGVLSGYDRVVIVDSIRTRDSSPGDWYRFTATELRETAHLRNIHDVNFATALALGRRLGHPLPPDDEIHLFAVEVEDASTFGDSLSPALAEAYPRVLAEILREIRALLRSGGP